MDHHCQVDLTLIYSEAGLETPVAHPGVTVTLFLNSENRTWSVLIDNPVNLIKSGLIRAEVILPDGLKLAGTARRPSALGNAFDLVEDAQPTELNTQLEARWVSLLGLIEVSDGQGATLDAGGRAGGYALGLFDAGAITEAQRNNLAQTASAATAAKIDRIERESDE